MHNDERDDDDIQSFNIQSVSESNGCPIIFCVEIFFDSNYVVTVVVIDSVDI